MELKRFKKKYTLFLTVLLFVISAGVSLTMLNRSQNLLSWDERSTGRSLVQLVIIQQSYLSLLAEHMRGEAVYENVLAHYDLTWSAYETVISGTKHAYFMKDARRLVKLKTYFKQFKETDPIENPLLGDHLINALHVTRQAHNYVVGLLNYEYQGISKVRRDRDIELVMLNKVMVFSLICVCFSGGLFLFIIFRDKRRMAYLAYHDPLTKVNNRSALKEKITQLRDANTKFCTLLLDIDRFKSINDNYGHDIGDELLVYLTQKMSSICGEVDFLGRLGGDEFAIIHLSKNAVEQVALNLLEITEKPIQIKGYRCDVGLSIGISYSSNMHEKWVDILKDADNGMYQAKQKGGNQYQIYTPD